MPDYTDAVTATDRHVVVEQELWAKVPEELLYDSSISANAVRIYGCLARHGSDPTNCYPSHARIAELLGMSERSIARPLNELVQSGWVTKIKRPALADGTRRPDAYYVHLTRSSARSTAQSSALPARDPARSQRAESRAEREPVEREPENETTRVAQPLTLLTADDAGPTFDAFWRAYPRHDGKPAAMRAWDKALKAAPVETIMAGLTAWLVYWTARAEPEFVPWAQKWLNQQQWNATPPTVRRSSRQPKGPGWSPTADEDAAARARPSGRITEL